MFAYTNQDGSVSICRTLRGVPSGTSFIQINSLPDGPRDAWKIDGNAVIIDELKRVPIVIKDIEIAVQKTIDDLAVSMGYDNVVSACSYAGSPHPKFGVEGTALRDYRDACWDKCYELLASFEAGDIEELSVDEVINQLPVYGE